MGLPMNEVDWTKTVFVLLGPDAFARHCALPILQRVIDAGYRPTAYLPIHTRPGELDRFYEKNIRTVWDAYRFRCVDLLFAFAPMIALLVEDVVTGREQGSHEPLRILKGESDPMKTEKGTIRGDFQSINQTLSMIHTSDTPEDAEYEVTVFFPPRGPLPLPRDSYDELLSACRLITPPIPERRGFDEVLGGFRAKLIMVVWNDLSQTGRDLVRGWEAEGGVYPFAEVGAGKLLAGHLPGVSHPLAGPLECEFQPDYPREDLARIRQLVGAYGVTLDRWEELVLTTSMFFRPRRRTPG